VPSYLALTRKEKGRDNPPFSELPASPEGEKRENSLLLLNVKKKKNVAIVRQVETRKARGGVFTNFFMQRPKKEKEGENPWHAFVQKGKNGLSRRQKARKKERSKKGGKSAPLSK